MNNFYTYTIDLRDRFSSALERAGASIRNTNLSVNGLRNSFGTLGNQLSSRNRILSQSFDELQAKIKKVESTIRSSKIPSEIRAARKELEALQRQSNNHLGRMGGGAGGKGGGGGGLMGMLGGAKGMLAGAGIGLAMSVIPMATDFLQDSVSKTFERQQIQTSFNVLAGSEQKGSALTNQLVGLQNDTVLGSEVFKNAQTMMGFGFDSTEVYENMKMLGDVSMGEAGKLQSLTLAFSQIKAAGKLAGQDLLQLINAGFNPLQTISEKTGKSIGELKDKMEKGGISFADVQQAFKDATGEGGRFENMLAKIAETPAGKVQQLAGQWDEFKIKAGGAFMPLISAVLDFASRLLPVIEGVIQPLSSGVQSIVGYIQSATTETGGWMDYINIIKDLFVDHYLGFLGSIWDLVKNIVSKFAEFIGKSELLKDVFGLVAGLYGFVYDALSWVIDKLGWLFDNIVMPILDGIDWAYSKIKELIGLGGNNDIDVNITPKPALAPSTPNNGTTNPPQNKPPAHDYLSGGGGGGKKGGKGSGSGGKTANSIATGGSKTTHITINLGNLVQTMNVTATSVQGGAEKVRDIVLDELSRALTMAQANV